MNPYPVPLEEIRREFKVLNSRFIATLAPVFSVDEARAFFSRIKAEFPDASHHVPAFIVGHGASETAHCSDAGEPSGTAGRPMLAVLQGSGLGDAAVIVVRYFGGTKLGTGGLVRAYGDAVRSVVDEVRRAEKRLACSVMAEFPYRFVERVRLLVTTHGGQILEEDFGAQVNLTARFTVDDFPGFQEGLRELTNGTVEALVVETSLALFPIK